MLKMMSISDFEYPQVQTTRSKHLPHVEVVEQPCPNALRFRYECERRSAGCIMGENSTHENKTYPTIKVHGYQGLAVIVISCVTRDDPPKPHPHSLVGRDTCRNGICSMRVNLHDGLVSFSNLGIQCVKKKQVKDALETRKHEKVDPFRTGFEHMNFPDTIDFNVIRLCFQVFILGPEKKFSVPLKPVVSGPIYDKKAMDELIICKLSECSAPVSGGKEIILLCGKITKDDIQVRFYEMRDDWLFWEGYGDFRPMHVHKQVAIVFKTPAYCNQDIMEPVTVNIQLRKKSDGSTSKSLPFLMLPLDIGDVNSLKRKRMKFDNDPKSYLVKQMQAQTEKQNAMLNQALLLNFIAPKFDSAVTPFGGGIVPRPSPIFQDQASVIPVNMGYNNNQVLAERRGFNIPFNQQRHPEEHDRSQAPSRFQAPVPQPRSASQVNSSSQSQARSLPPQPQPRRRTEPAPPNVTIHSYAYRESMSAKHRLQGPRYSFNQQSEVEANGDDPFELDDLPSNFDQLSPQDLAVLETINSDNISESLSENLSKGLSISDHIQDTLQNIQELNRDVEATQQQSGIKLWRNNERNEDSTAGSSYNPFARQVYGGHMDQGGIEAALFS